MKGKTKKILLSILKLLPIISAPTSYLLIISKYDSIFIRGIIDITTLLAFAGIGFFFIGRKIAKESILLKILGILDIIATVYVIALYTIAIFAFGL